MNLILFENKYSTKEAKMKSIIALIFWASVSITQSYKILSIATQPSKSFFYYNHAILKPLIKAGHEITLITQYAEESAQENFTSIIDIYHKQSIRYVGQGSVEEYLKKTFNDWQDFIAEVDFSLCKTVLNLKEIQDFMKSKEKLFDAMMITNSHHHACFYKIARKLDIPVIAILAQRSWFATELEISHPRHPLLVPMEMGSDINLDTVINKIFYLLKYAKNLFYWYMLTDSASNNLKNYVKPAIVFVNGHSSYFPRPLNPNMIEIGGIQIDETQPLPEELQNFLDGATQGAILFTFGSAARAATMSKTKTQAFVEAFAEIPQRVIWKYEEEIEEISPNVMLMKWVPQKEILAHKNLKAFISHCGQGALHETLHYAVPLISCPLTADQPINAQLFENLEVAVRLDYETITKESVLKAINEVINNTKYYDKMQKLSHAFRDRPMSPQETVVYWTEYVIRHKGAPHLRSPAMELNWFQYFLLDVICFIIFTIFVILFAIYLICKLTYSYITSFRLKNVKKKSH